MKNLVLFTSVLLASLIAAAGAEAAVSFVPFQRFVQSPCAGSGILCEIGVHAVPAKRRLEVENVSCTIDVAAGVNIDQVFARQSAFIFDFFVPTLMHETGRRIFVFNTQTKFVVPPGQALGVGVVATGDVNSLQCKVAGELTIF